jgi:hypothetical protein
MNVKIGTEAAQFLGKEYINESFLAVRGISFSDFFINLRRVAVLGNNY